MSKTFSFKKVFFSYQAQVTIVVMLVMLCVLSVSNILVDKFILESQINNIRSRLKLIAQTAALMINAEDLKSIPLNRTGIDSAGFQAIARTLNTIKAIDPQIRYIYIMGASRQPGHVQFIVDPEILSPTQSHQKAPAVPGDLYNASQMPDLIAAFDKPSADRALTHDAWGSFLSGYAPIRDSSGQTAGILGVDVTADDITQTLQTYKNRVWLCFQICLVFGLLLGLLMARSITRPVKKLAYGIRRVARGDLQYRMSEDRHDEIGELVHEFNGMSRKLYRSRRQLLSYFSSVVRSLIRVLEARNPYTKGHSDNVAIYASKIALRMGFPREDVKIFKKISLLHDIGKVGVCDDILNKPGPLTQAEYEELKKHPAVGESIVKPVMKNPQWLSIIRSHHERVDGSGYPDRLSGSDINIFAAIVAVADAYDAMTSDRAYRKAMPQAEARAELLKHRGTQFHPDVVDAFVSVLDDESRRTPKS